MGAGPGWMLLSHCARSVTPVDPPVALPGRAPPLPPFLSPRPPAPAPPEASSRAIVPEHAASAATPSAKHDRLTHRAFFAVPAGGSAVRPEDARCAALL